MKQFLIVMSLLLTAARAQALDVTPEREVVRTADDAIRLVYAYWRVLAPDGAFVAEAAWRAKFDAVLQKDVWCVSAKHAPGEPAWFGMYVGAKDGRYLGAFDLGTPQKADCGTPYGPRRGN